jgi:hypothetical protein
MMDKSQSTTRHTGANPVAKDAGGLEGLGKHRSH